MTTIHLVGIPSEPAFVPGFFVIADCRCGRVVQLTRAEQRVECPCGRVYEARKPRT